MVLDSSVAVSMKMPIGLVNEAKKETVEICWSVNLHRTHPVPARFRCIRGTDGVPGAESNSATSSRAEQELP